MGPGEWRRGWSSRVWRNRFPEGHVCSSEQCLYQGANSLQPAEPAYEDGKQHASGVAALGSLFTVTQQTCQGLGTQQPMT